MAVATPQLWGLPDELIFRVVSFAAAPTHRATIVCHSLAPLCRDAYRNLLQDESIAVQLWDTILREDYGVVGNDLPKSSYRKKKNISIVADDNRPLKRRRSCSRLRRTPVQYVRDAHRLMNDNTEIAHFYLAEMINCSSNTSPNKLTRVRLVALLNEYGPHLRLNRTVSSGGLFLAEVCRAKHVTASVIHKCVQELVEQRGALVNLSTSESDSSQLTPLCIAAVRGLSTVVSYLLRKGACRDIVSSGRFALHTLPKKSIRCRDQTPLEFAVAMRLAEKEAGADDASLNHLDQVIRLLS